MSLVFCDGVFRVSCCARGHVTLEVLEGDAVKFVAVMSRAEAAGLASRLSSACGRLGARRPHRAREVH